jgi:DNA-binding transcriptional ArsR family regulator
MINQSKKPNSDDPLNWTGTLKALADESRLQIIHALLKQDLTVQDLADNLNIKIYNISKHLKILEASGIVQKKKEGIQRIYHITARLKSRFSEDDQVLDLGCCKFMFGDPLK